jgi:thiosulfate/3-mercaptopyruvate sulfurtransferase
MNLPNQLLECSRRRFLYAVGGVLTASILPRSPVGARLAAHPGTAPVTPWTRAQTVEPDALAKALATTSRPTVFCVGFQSLYRGGHVPRASYHGPASSPEGLADLKRWAQGLSRSDDVVLYCGCCPFADCPNISPAFVALRDMGFTHLRVLLLPKSFGADWVSRGLPTAR